MWYPDILMTARQPSTCGKAEEVYLNDDKRHKADSAIRERSRAGQGRDLDVVSRRRHWVPSEAAQTRVDTVGDVSLPHGGAA